MRLKLEAENMKLSVEWSQPVPLKDATRQNLIYSLVLAKLPVCARGICLRATLGQPIQSTLCWQGNGYSS